LEDSLEQININPKQFDKIERGELVSAREHSLALPEQESCGLFCDFGGKIKFIPCKNISPYPGVAFEIDACKVVDFDVKYIFHSHVGGYSEYPSSFDIKYCRELCIPFIIYSLSRDSFFVYDNIGV
tara:strand:- start:2841 stop:3218 length:378 start_codon:yes stop_codon:yes gene_type:complete